MSSPFSMHSTARASRLRISLQAALALSFLAAFQGALAAPQPLTLGEAQQRASARSRQLGAQDQAIVAANEMAVAAGQRPDPVLKVGIDNLPVSGSDRLSLGNDFMTMRRLGVSQELTTSDKRKLRSQIYELEADKAVASKAAATAAIERYTALAWLDSYFARQMATVVTDQRTQARNEIEAAEGAYRAGRASQADVLAARAALIAVEDRASEIDQRSRSASAMLTRWTGTD